MSSQLSRHWTESDIPDLHGKTAVVTGLGLETARMLSEHGAAVIMACGGEYYGPDGWNEWTGYPVRAESIPRSNVTVE